jgi:hypothetical protein
MTTASQTTYSHMQALTRRTGYVRCHNQSGGWRAIFTVARESCELAELCVQLLEHHPRRTGHQQDRYQMVLPDRSCGNAAAWFSVLRKRKIPYRMVSPNGQCKERQTFVVSFIATDASRSSKAQQQGSYTLAKLRRCCRTQRQKIEDSTLVTMTRSISS